MEINSYIILLSSVVVSSFSQILLKKSTKKEHTSFIREYLNLNVIVGYSMMLISTILTVFAFRKLDYKNGPILESTGYILVMILSYLFLSEKITKRKLLGNLLILVGIFVFYI